MKAMMPYIFRDGETLSPEAVNANLLAGRDDVNDNLSRRWTHFTQTFRIDGMADTDHASRRTIPLLRPPSNQRYEIESIEIFAYGTDAKNLTLTGVSGLSRLDDIVLEMAGATVEATTQAPVRAFITNTSTLMRVDLDASTTVTAGWINVKCKMDRGQQGSSPNHAGYSPTLVGGATLDTGSLLDTELTALAAAVARDASNDLDYRCVVHRLNGVTGATTAAVANMEIPAMGARIAQLQVGAMTTSGPVDMDVAVYDELGASVASAALSGVAANTFTEVIASASDTQPEDLDDDNDDYVIEPAPAGGTWYGYVIVLFT